MLLRALDEGRAAGLTERNDCSVHKSSQVPCVVQMLEALVVLFRQENQLYTGKSAYLKMQASTCNLVVGWCSNATKTQEVGNSGDFEFSYTSVAVGLSVLGPRGLLNRGADCVKLRCAKNGPKTFRF